jgi:hypothetical protein
MADARWPRAPRRTCFPPRFGGTCARLRAQGKLGRVAPSSTSLSPIKGARAPHASAAVHCSATCHWCATTGLHLPDYLAPARALLHLLKPHSSSPRRLLPSSVSLLTGTSSTAATEPLADRSSAPTNPQNRTPRDHSSRLDLGFEAQLRI